MRKKTVWVVVGGWNYEGNDIPTGVYSSKRLAQKAFKKIKMYYGYDYREIKSYVLDEMPEDRSQPL